MASPSLLPPHSAASTARVPADSRSKSYAEIANIHAPPNRMKLAFIPPDLVDGKSCLVSIAGAQLHTAMLRDIALICSFGMKKCLVKLVATSEHLSWRIVLPLLFDEFQQKVLFEWVPQNVLNVRYLDMILLSVTMVELLFPHRVNPHIPKGCVALLVRNQILLLR